MNNEQLRKANRNAALRWGGFIVALLGLQVAGGAGAIYLATGDPSVAVVPDYHQKALHWDEQIELQKQSAALNWNVQMDVAPGNRGQGLVVQIKNDQGDLVKINSGELRLYHHSRAGDVRRIPVQWNVAQPIVVKDCFGRVGLWQVELDLKDPAGQRFIDSRSVNVRSMVAPREAT